MAMEEEFKELRKLLNSWNTQEVYPQLLVADINVAELKIMKRHHLAELLGLFGLGTRIRFEHNFVRWRELMNLPIDGEQHSQPRRSERLLERANTPKKRTRYAMEQDSSSEGENTEEESSNEEQQQQQRRQQQQQQQQQLDDITVVGILGTRGRRGESLINIIGQQKPLEMKQRQVLVQMICSHYVNNNIPLSVAQSQKMEREILELYPKERLDSYRNGRHGEMYMRFRNMMRNKRGNPSTSQQQEQQQQQQPNVPKRVLFQGAAEA